MVRFIYDNCVKVVAIPCSTSERLYRPYRHLFDFIYIGFYVSGFSVIFISCLIQQFRPVRQYQDLFAIFGLSLRYSIKYYSLSLSAPCWKYQQGALSPFMPFVFYCVNRCRLVISQNHNRQLLLVLFLFLSGIQV